MNRRVHLGICRAAAMVITSGCLLPCLAQNIPAATGEIGAITPAFRLHLMQLAKEVPACFTVLPQPPFVVRGDESPEAVHRAARQHAGFGQGQRHDGSMRTLIFLCVDRPDIPPVAAVQK
jgi:hypothetical protein